MYITKPRNRQVLTLVSVSETVYIYIKEKIIDCVKVISGEKEKIGVKNVAVQIDETAYCRRSLIYQPTSEAPYIRDTKWVIGIQYESTQRIRL